MLRHNLAFKVTLLIVGILIAGLGTLLALNKKTGEVLWRCKEWTDNAEYSSAILATVDGVRQYIQEQFQVVLSSRTCLNYLHRQG